ncbi:MAG TPA: hypothetical protein VHY79_09630 [Rhizomicrobium sp.]|jgi:hypothetical protein|nr:hypothetical protein [Rhizomicrobium sp.]
MKIALIAAAAALGLASCASGPQQPMTPQQQAMFTEMMRENAARQQDMYDQQMANIRANQPPPLVNCVTNYVGGYAYTNCQ